MMYSEFITLSGKTEKCPLKDVGIYNQQEVGSEMTAKEIFRKAQRDAEEYVKKNELNIIVYMSGTKNKRTMLEKLLKEHKEDSDLDFELGVINKDIHDFEMKIYEIIRKSIENYILY